MEDYIYIPMLIIFEVYLISLIVSMTFLDNDSTYEFQSTYTG